jgi:hypothetical protein
MYDFAYSVQIIKSHEALFGHDPHQRQGHPFIVVPLDHFQQVHAQDFEHDHKVTPVRPVVQKTIQYLHALTIFRSYLPQLIRIVTIILFE